jgi:polysaccharide export outer membrane protein
VKSAHGNPVVRRVVALLLAAAINCPILPAQQAQQRSAPTASSELTSENLNRVAASPAQIQAVLAGQPGLMVELKRWVAKEATERGQIVEDSELTDQGIYDRLGRDLEFRAVATRLLQRYGYLVPKMNPESDFAKEQDLLLKERARRQALAEEQDTAVGRGARRNELERTGACDPARDPDCVQEEAPTRGRPQPASRTLNPPAQNAPELRDRAVPRQLQQNPLEDIEPRSRQLIQTTAEVGPAPASGLVPRTAEPLAVGTSPELASTESRPPRLAEDEERGASGVSTSRTAERGRSAQPRTRGPREELLGQPAMVRRPNPYADIPSLYDMYVQASARPASLERFGLEVFRNGTRDSEMLPMDLPAGPDYVVGPGDGLAVDLWGGVAQRLYRTVDREGRLSLPEVGPLLVSGRTLGEVQQAVQQVLRTQFRDVSADVSLSRLRTVRIYVVGDVAEPGAYDISSLSTPLNALFSAGGPTGRGSLRALKHYRGKQLIEEVDAYDLLLRGVRSDLKRLESGDTLLISPTGPQVTVEGMVRRPAVYELRGEKTLADVLELAGGILPTATLRHIEVQRIESHEKRTMLSLDVSQAQDSEEVRKQLEAFAIRDGDEIHIFPIAPYNQDTVYLMGHVLRPGRYSYRTGMTLADLVSSYKDLLPEPATKYAEIIRLNAPDFRPSVESFDLAAALANPAAAPKLQPLDTVRILSRYDVEDAPTVWVGGEVRSPGPYRPSGQVHLRDAVYLAGGVTPDTLLDSAQLVRSMSDGSLRILSINLKEALAGNPLDNILLQPRDRLLIQRNPAKVDPPSVYIKGEIGKPGRYPLTTNLHVADLIRLAGGLKRSAFADSADLTRYDPKITEKQLGEHQDISIGAALAGDANADLPLRDGDVLTIRQLPGWSDIGASISVQGEVEHAGTYGIRPDERLSSVLKRAGGFRPTAYPQGVVLERIEVRNLQEKSRQELIRQLEQEASSFKVSALENAKDQAEIQQAAFLQRQRALEAVRNAPVSGRLVIHLPAQLAKFENSPDDLEVRAGDTLTIPKRPNFVAVVGQVYNSNAINYVRGRSAGWYLGRAGGATRLADKKAIFIVRANGSVVSGQGGSAWWNGNVLSTHIEPGDTIVVPERPIGGSPFWKNLLTLAQIAQSGTIAALVVTR